MNLFYTDKFNKLKMMTQSKKCSKPSNNRQFRETWPSATVPRRHARYKLTCLAPETKRATRELFEHPEFVNFRDF